MKIPGTVKEALEALEELAEKREKEQGQETQRRTDPQICLLSRHAVLTLPSWLRNLSIHLGRGCYDFLLENNGIASEKDPLLVIHNQVSMTVIELGVAADVLAEIAAQPEDCYVEDKTTLKMCALAGKAIPKIHEAMKILREARQLVPTVPHPETPTSTSQPPSEHDGSVH